MSSLPRVLGATLVALLTAASGCDGQFEFDRGPAPAGAAGLAAVASGCSNCAAVGLYCATEWQACVECTDDAHCPSGAPHCDAALHRCAPCDPTGGCGSGSVCDDWSHGCLRSCASDVDPDHDCRGSSRALICDLDRSVCVVCRADADCSDERLPHCLPGGSRCAECGTDADCGGFVPHCDPLAFACVECRDSRDCAAPAWCDPSAHQCESPSP